MSPAPKVEVSPKPSQSPAPVLLIDPSPVPELEAAPSTDWGMYRCEVCGQMAMGFAREEHVRKVHKGAEVGWGRVGG